MTRGIGILLITILMLLAFGYGLRPVNAYAGNDVTAVAPQSMESAPINEASTKKKTSKWWYVVAGVLVAGVAAGVAGAGGGGGGSSSGGTGSNDGGSGDGTVVIGW